MLTHGIARLQFDDTFDLKAQFQSDYNGNVLRTVSTTLKETEHSIRKRIGAGVPEDEYVQLNLMLNMYIIAYENVQLFWKFCNTKQGDTL